MITKIGKIVIENGKISVDCFNYDDITTIQELIADTKEYVMGIFDEIDGLNEGENCIGLEGISSEDIKWQFREDK